MDLFGYDRDEPQPHTARQIGARPWEGCDTTSEAWRSYCEAIDMIRGGRSKRPEEYLRSVEKHRGAFARRVLEQSVILVRRDLKGEVYPRERIGERLDAIPIDLRKADERAAMTSRSKR